MGDLRRLGEAAGWSYRAFLALWNTFVPQTGVDNQRLSFQSVKRRLTLYTYRCPKAWTASASSACLSTGTNGIMTGTSCCMTSTST